MQGTAILRERRIRDYFNNRLAELIEAVTLPDCRNHFTSSLNRIENVRGAVEYAYMMGDIQLPYMKNLTDTLDELYREEMEHVGDKVANSMMIGKDGRKG